LKEIGEEPIMLSNLTGLCLALATLTAPQAEVVESLLEYNDTDLVIIAYMESRFDRRAVSSAGAKGVMQLMPVAVKDVYQHGCGERELPLKFDVWNPEHNILVGYCYWTLLRNQYKLPLPLAVAAYNFGPGRVRAHTWPRETRRYVREFFKLKEKSCSKP
jgi:soluble lytic murein transglycosylase